MSLFPATFHCTTDNHTRLTLNVCLLLSHLNGALPLEELRTYVNTHCGANEWCFHWSTTSCQHTGHSSIRCARWECMYYMTRHVATTHTHTHTHTKSLTFKWSAEVPTSNSLNPQLTHTTTNVVGHTYSWISYVHPCSDNNSEGKVWWMPMWSKDCMRMTVWAIDACSMI